MSMMMVGGREVYASMEMALAKQQWLQTWCDDHSSELRPGTLSIEAKETIPEETYPLDDPPVPAGTVGRAEVNFLVMVQGDDDKRLSDLCMEVVQNMFVDEVMGWVDVSVV